MSTTTVLDTAVPTLSALLRERGVRVVVLDMSKDPNAKVTLMLLAERAPDRPWARAFRRASMDVDALGDVPALGRVVKVPTTDIAEVVVATEAGRLTALGQRLPETLRSTIPDVLGMADADGRAALIVSALPGTPMATLYHRWRHTARRPVVTADFAAASTWLARFQAATAGRPIALGVGEETMERLSARFSGEPGLGRALETLAADDARLSQVTVARTAVHGDFWCGNLLIEGSRITGVVDWEAASMAGLPTRDLARFALSYSLYLDRHTRSGHAVTGHAGLRAEGWGAGIRYALTAGGWYPSLVRSFVQSGLTRIGAPASLWLDVLHAGLAEVAVSADHADFAAHHLNLLASLPAAHR